MTLDWNSLRPDPKDNFEELCCQLARYEPTPDNSKIVRKGTPDAGVECFWELPDSSEWGWQAKWFQTSPSPTQWGEIDDSVEKALEKHPSLTKYVIVYQITEVILELKDGDPCWINGINVLKNGNKLKILILNIGELLKLKID